MRRRLLILAAFVAVGFLTRGVLLGVGIVDLDEAAHIVGSWELLRGQLPYTNFADHKPPLVYVYYALAQLLLGRGMLAVRLLTLLVTVPFTAHAASAFFRHDRRGVVAGLLYLVYGAAFLGHDMLAVNCELLMMLPLSWALVAVRNEDAAGRPGRLLLAGLLVGVGVLFKYQAAFWLPALALAAGSAGRTLRRHLGAWGALGTGFALPLVLTYLLFRAAGGADGFVYWNLTHNLDYTVSTVRWEDALERAAAYLLPFLLVTSPLWWGWRRSLSRCDSPYRSRLVSALVAFSAASGLLGFRLYPHYFIPLYLPLSLAAAPFLEECLRRPLDRRGRWIVAWSVVALVGFTVVNGWMYLGGGSVEGETRPVYGRVAERLRADPCFPGASLFVWGFAPSFYYAADLPVASRFLLVSTTLVGYVSGRRGGDSDPGLGRPEHWDWLMSDLERSQATFILDTAESGLGRWHYPVEDFPRLDRFLHKRYEATTVVDRVRIYRRRGCQGGAGER